MMRSTGLRLHVQTIRPHIPQLMYLVPHHILPSRTSLAWHNTTRTRQYANPARLSLPSRLAFRPPPPPVAPTTTHDGDGTALSPTLEQPHTPGDTETSPEATEPLDHFINEVAQAIYSDSATSVAELYSQYQKRAETVLEYVIPYEERPSTRRRIDCVQNSRSNDEAGVVREGDGIVMVVHASLKLNGKLDKICACSGFVVEAQPVGKDQNKQGRNEHDVVVTCAHTLEEMYRKIPETSADEIQSDSTEGQLPTSSQKSFSFIIPAGGASPRIVSEVLSSMPRSDVIALKVEAGPAPALHESDNKQTAKQTNRLRSLPLSPYPIATSSGLLTHLFGSPHPPKIIKSLARLPASSSTLPAMSESEVEKIQTPVPFVTTPSTSQADSLPNPEHKVLAYRTLALGRMLGYRSYTNIEVEAGIHSSLPHIQSSILPTPGSSGGPLICAETGAVVGMISGRRMDNRVEGERGWGASCEGIFEMFSLPGLTPI